MAARDFDTPQPSVSGDGDLSHFPSSMPSPAITALPDGAIDFINQRWLDYLGLSLEEVRDKGWTVAIHPDDVKRFVSDWRTSITAGEPFALEARFRRSDGAYRRFLLTIEPLRDEQGSLVRWHGTRIDIEDRKRGEEKFKALLESAPDGMVVIDEGGTILIVNSQTEQLFGYDREELYGQPVEMLMPERYRGGHRGHRSGYFQKPKARAMGAGLELYGLRKDGSEFPIDISLSPPITEEGVMATAAIRDITERKKAEALLAGENRLLEMIAKGDALASILDALCRFVEEISAGSVCSILILDSDGVRLRHGAAPSLPRSYTEAIDGSLIGPSAGSCGTAAYRKEPVIVSDIATDPLWADYRDLAVNHGLRAAWSTPIFSSEGAVLGTFAIYSRAPHSPTPEQQSIVAQFTPLAATAIERKRAEDRLSRSEAYLAEAQRLSHTGSFGWMVSTGALIWSEETFRIAGYDTDARPTLDLVLRRVHPEDIALVQRTLDDAIRDGADLNFEHRLLMPDGSVKHVRVMAHAVRHQSGVLEYVGAVSDVTAVKKAEEMIRQHEREFRQIVEAIPEHIVVLAPDGSLLYANRTVLEYTGLTLDSVQVEDFRKRAFHPEDVKRLRDERRQALSRGMPFELEQRMLRNDGQYRWFLIHYRPMLDERGRVLRWYATGTDIHDRKQTEVRVHNENIALREEIDKASMFEEIVGASPALKNVLARVAKVAPTASTVLIIGETGTGKELIARAIHKRSPRSSHAFISVNCAAIPTSLLASELFGHEKGAFTGALQRRLGRFELAEGGTIFLDEIGELPVEMQLALLRVLQEHEFERVGGRQPIRANVRVIAATNRNLKVAIESGDFRSDLFYRLNVFPVEVPPLRMRQEDIPLLVEYFVDRFASKAGKKIREIDRKTLELLQSYTWPGNVREVQNVIERSVILTETGILSVDESWLTHDTLPLPRTNQSLSRHLILQEKEMIESALTESRGRVSGPAGAAARLGIPASTLESKIRSLKINKYQFKTV